MSSAPELDDALAAVGRRYHLSDLRLDHEQMTTLVFSDGPPVTIEFVDGAHPRVFLIAELPSIREGQFDEMATALLAVNGRWLDTAGASFALHPHSDKVLSILPVPAFALNAGMLPGIVERFLASCRTWAGRINRGETEFSLRGDIEAELELIAIL